MHLRDGLQTHATVRQRYDHLVDTGAIERDPAQERIAAALDSLTSEISAKRLAHKSSALGWLFARKRETREVVKGLYIHGGVGRGKTMLMDMFFELLSVRRKRRVHFNDFMAGRHVNFIVTKNRTDEVCIFKGDVEQVLFAGGIIMGIGRFE